MLPQSVVEATRIAFRFPPGTTNIDDALLGLRYLQSLLSIGEKHGLLPAAGGSFPWRTYYELHSASVIPVRQALKHQSVSTGSACQIMQQEQST